MSTHSGHGGDFNTCPDPACVEHRRRYQKHWRYERAHGKKRLTDATPARLKIATLQGMGWSLRSIAAAADTSPTVISRITKGQASVQVKVGRAILAIDTEQVPSRASKQTIEPFVPRVGAVRRIQALLRMGWTHEEMFRRSGIRTGCVLHQQGRWITRSTHDALAAMYRELCTTLGPSERTRGRAERRGYLAPTEWNDIDLDPEPDALEPEDDDEIDEVVVQRVLAGERMHTTTAERYEIVRRWPSTGRPLADLERMGWKPERYKTEEEMSA